MERPGDKATFERPTAARSCAALLLVISLFGDRVVEGAYDGFGRPMPEALTVLGSLVMVTSLYAWFWSYSHTHRISWPMDMGFFVFAGWTLLLPYYILRAEGRRGWATIGLFCLTWIGANATGWAIQIWAQVIQ